MTLLVTLSLLVAGAQMASQPESGISMFEIQACRVAFTGEAINQGRWGGQIAVYDITVGPNGRATDLRRRHIEKSAHLIQWVQLAQLEDCIRQWRFGISGSYVVSLTGGTIFGREWLIDVSSANDGRLRLRNPWPDTRR
jgi:hypothetical protein